MDLSGDDMMGNLFILSPPDDAVIYKTKEILQIQEKGFGCLSGLYWKCCSLRPIIRKPLGQLVARCPAVKSLGFICKKGFFQATEGLDGILAESRRGEASVA